jgi:hypothetical protein
VWPWILEGCGEVLAATAHGRPGPPLAAGVAVLVMALVLVEGFGMRGLVPLALFVVAVFVVARDVFAARDALWRAADSELDEPGQAPSAEVDARVTAPTAVALRRLARAVDRARRGAFVEASDLVPVIDRDLLRPEELRLLDAVRALVSAGLGDDARAAQQAVVALPTGSDAIDAALGRVLLARAWDDPGRLRVIELAWGQAGVPVRAPGALPALRRLARLRLDPEEGHDLAAADALALAEHARAVGDDGLALELEQRGRSTTAYR